MNLMVAFLALITVQMSAVAATINPDLKDDYLGSQFDWAMYLDVRAVPSYLNYQGSRLHPLTRVRVYLRKYSRHSTDDGNVQLYEDFWYHKGQVLGLRRRMPLKLGGNDVGSIVIGPCGNNVESRAAAVNAMLRVMVELQVRRSPTSVVMVPEDKFAGIGEDLAYYNFEPHMSAAEGEQLSVHLRSYPGTLDEYYWLQK